MRVISVTAGPLYPPGKNPDTHWVEDWVGLGHFE